MTMIRIAPAQGRVLRNPDTGERIPAEGALVRRSPYWRRRLQDGDAIVLSDADVATSPEEAAPATQDTKPARARTAKED